MKQMFINASAFNQNISSWDVNNITTLQTIFGGTSMSQSNTSYYTTIAAKATALSETLF